MTTAIAQDFYCYHTVHQPLAGPAEFGPEHLQLYREQGFIAIENVFTPREIEAAKQAMRGLIDEADPDIVSFEPAIDIGALPQPERAQYARRLFRFVQHSPVLQELSEDPTLLSIVRQLAGEEVRLLQDMALMKPAHAGSEKPWHQDTAYFLIDPPEKVIGTWTALDHATAENGCMHVVPGSHRAGPLPHYHDRDCMLPDDPARSAQDVMVPLAPGGVLFFSGLLHHGTPPNTSPTARWALQYHYAGLSCRPLTHDEHGAHFHDAHGAATCAHASTEAMRRMPSTGN